MLADDQIPQPAPLVPRCSQCGRERTVHDAYDYSPLQVVTNQPVGWYSGDDGELCPEHITELLRPAGA